MEIRGERGSLFNGNAEEVVGGFVLDKLVLYF